MSQPRRLSPGASVDGSECWFRTITNSGHITRDETLSLQALKGQFKPTVQPGWSHELSGRLASLAGTSQEITADAHARVAVIRQKFKDQGKPIPSKIQFVGVACGLVAELRSTSLVSYVTDVLYTPQTPNDEAHSDLVTKVETEDELDGVKASFTRRIRVVRADDLHTRLSGCGK